MERGRPARRRSDCSHVRCGRDARAPAFFVLLCFLLACRGEIPSVIVIPEGAAELDYVRFRGADYVSFKLQEPYPASKTIGKISQSLQQRGWTPLKETYLHPEIPSSIVVGWTFYEEKKGNSFIYEWATDWRDSQNNILSYSFKYMDRLEKYRQRTFVLKPTSNRLIVAAIFLPQDVADSRRKEAAGDKTK